VLTDIRGDDHHRVEREAPLDQVVEQAGQVDLRDVDQEVDVLGGSLASSQGGRQPADERMADRSGRERLGDRRDGPIQFVGQEAAINSHDEPGTPGCSSA
jgi:hypothetical protein